MAEEGRKDWCDANVEPRVTVQASDIVGIAVALGMELVEEQASGEAGTYASELYEVLDTLTDIYQDVELATENDNRGCLRKVVYQYADR